MDILIGLFYSVLILRFIQTVYWYRRGEASIQVLQCMTGIAIAFLLMELFPILPLELLLGGRFVQIGAGKGGGSFLQGVYCFFLHILFINSIVI